MKLAFETGDITTFRGDALVNAANSSLLGGGGVDGAIHRAAGPQLLVETRALRARALPQGLQPGQAVSTGGGALGVRYVIHTVGPNRHAGETDPEVLAMCFASCLECAHYLKLRTLAFPAIGAGVYGWEAEDVASAARAAFDDFAGDFPGSTVSQATFVLSNDRIRGVFKDAFAA